MRYKYNGPLQALQPAASWLVDIQVEHGINMRRVQDF